VLREFELVPLHDVAVTFSATVSVTPSSVPVRLVPRDASDLTIIGGSCRERNGVKRPHPLTRRLLLGRSPLPDSRNTGSFIAAQAHQPAYLR
jgi:hypothetical protein